MSLLLDSIKESELKKALSALALKMKEIEKRQENLTKKIDEMVSEEYNDLGFGVNERNDC